MLSRVVNRSFVRSFAAEAKATRMSPATRHLLDLNGDGKVDFDDVKYVVNNVRASRQAKFWGAVAFTGFFAAFGGLNLFSQMSKPMPADQKFFKWGGIYSRFHPEAGEEVGKKWGVKLTKPNEKGA